MPRRSYRYEDKATKTARTFCTNCGTPIIYERPRSPHMVNIPRALFSGRTGLDPLYHIAIEELQEWAYTGEPLVPLKGFPGVVWQRSKKKKRAGSEGMFASLHGTVPRTPCGMKCRAAEPGPRFRCDIMGPGSAAHRHALRRVRDANSSHNPRPIAQRRSSLVLGAPSRG